MSKAIITAAGPNMQPMLDCAEPTFQTFANVHGYELIVDRTIDDSPDRNDDQSRATRWAKVDMMRHALQTHDLAVWLDADVMITKFDRDIADDIIPTDFQAFVLEQFPTRFNPNSGVWVMRQDPMSQEFLDTIQKIGQVGTIFADQGAICTALGWEVARAEGNRDIIAKPVHPSPFLARTGWLPPEWNPLGMAANWPSRVQHFAGLANEARLPLMQKLHSELLASGELT